MDNKPLVSILAPAYNASGYIRRFLESALVQSLESYEVIVVVDTDTTDNTLEILEEYRKEFPDKLFVFPSDTPCCNIAQKRNIGFKKSRGDYIFWCDSDDILHPCGLSVLYKEAVENACDFVTGNAIQLTIGNNNLPEKASKEGNQKTQNISNEHEIAYDGASWWVKLIKRTLFEKVGPDPEECFFDDVAFLPVIESYAEKIRHVNTVVYYYHRKKEGSASTTSNAKVASSSIQAEKYALERCNQKYLKAVQFYVASRTRFNLDFRWPFYDLFAQWAREQMSWLNDNELVKNNKHIYNALQSAAKLAGPTIPNNIYVSGFERKPSDERIAELGEKVFYDGCEIKILSGDNCEIDSNEYIKDAVDKGKTEFAAEYFALKNIYENGGFYIHDRVKILNYFSYIKNQNAVFFRLDNTTYSNYIFGAPPKNAVIEDILKTYSYKWDKRKCFTPLAERIKIILTAKYDIPLNGSAKWFSDPVSVVPANCGAMNIEWGKAICEHDFSDFAGNDEYITVKKSTLTDTIPVIASGAANKQLADRNAVIAREFEDMKQTNTYKLMMKIRSVGDSPVGPPLKKVFHGMLKVRRKLKGNK